MKNCKVKVVIINCSETKVIPEWLGLIAPLLSILATLLKLLHGWHRV
jgi:hypothetical protein